MAFKGIYRRTNKRFAELTDRFMNTEIKKTKVVLRKLNADEQLVLEPKWDAMHSLSH